MLVTYEKIVAKCAEDAGYRAEHIARREFEADWSRAITVTVAPSRLSAPAWDVVVAVPRPEIVWRASSICSTAPRCAYRRGVDRRWRSLCGRYRFERMEDLVVRRPTERCDRCRDCDELVVQRAMKRGTLSAS